jgi:hypothetical protein
MFVMVVMMALIKKKDLSACLARLLGIRAVTGKWGVADVTVTLYRIGVTPLH